MGANVEIKARLRDPIGIRRTLESRGERVQEVWQQEDTFFRVASGRLKLRRVAPDRGELIFYQRDDAVGPKLCRYLLSPTSDPTGLRDLLAAALGIRGTVRKIRWLYLVGQTRVHLDSVTGLGDFLELEIVLRENQSAEEGTRIARGLMSDLGIRESDLVEGAYIDLLERDGAA